MNRRTKLALIPAAAALAVGGFAIAACGDTQPQPSGQAPYTDPYSEPSAPYGIGPPTVSDVACSPAPNFSDGVTVQVSFTIKNDGQVPASYDLIFAVKDTAGVRTGTFGVDYGTIAGPLPAGQVAKYSNPHG